MVLEVDFEDGFLAVVADAVFFVMCFFVADAVEVEEGEDAPTSVTEVNSKRAKAEAARRFIILLNINSCSKGLARGERIDPHSNQPIPQY